MKVLMLNGSPRANGNTALALTEIEKIFSQEGIEVETVHIGHLAVRGCIACGSCYQEGKCVFDDVVNQLAPKFQEGRRSGGCYTGILRFCQRYPHRHAGSAVLQYPV